MNIGVALGSVLTLLFLTLQFSTVAAATSANSTFILTSFIDASETAWREMNLRGPGQPRSSYYPDGWRFYHQLDDHSASRSAPTWTPSSASCLNHAAFDSNDACAIVHKSTDEREGCWTMHPSPTASMVAEYTFDRDFNAGLMLSVIVHKPYTCGEVAEFPPSYDGTYFSLFVGPNTILLNIPVPCQESPFTYMVIMVGPVRKGSTIEMKVSSGGNADFDAVVVNLAIEAKCSDSRVFNRSKSTACATTTYPAPSATGSQDQVTNCPYEEAMCDPEREGPRTPWRFVGGCLADSGLIDTSTGKLREVPISLIPSTSAAHHSGLTFFVVVCVAIAFACTLF